MRRLAFLLLCLAVSTVYADKGGRHHGDHDDDDDRDEHYSRPAARPVVLVFRSEDHRAIYDYYRAYPSHLPPGLAKRNGRLPPGLEKQLYRNGHLPPGTERVIVAFPPELDRRLPPLPVGYCRGFIGDRVVIYDPKRQLIVDALEFAIAEVSRPR